MSIGVALSLTLLISTTIGPADAGPAAEAARFAATQGGGQPQDLRGGWQAERYTLKDGTSHVVQGQILFTERDWTVLFLVVANGKAERGAGEGGTYTVAGDKVTLTHKYHVSAGRALPGLPESPLRMERLADTDSRGIEPCTFEITGDRLVLRFPSGNVMTFVRSS